MTKLGALATRDDGLAQKPVRDHARPTGAGWWPRHHREAGTTSTTPAILTATWLLELRVARSVSLRRYSARSYQAGSGLSSLPA
jgi:hypothetical protein